jgi:hypothetical protein
MDSHIYTREILEKHLLRELKEIAQCFSLIPEGNKALRKTWISALVGMPFPATRLIDYQPQKAVKNPPSVEREPLIEAVKNPPGVEREPLMEAAEHPPGIDRAQELPDLPDEKSLDVDRAQEIEFPDLESARAEIARLRAQNEKLIQLVRSQSEIIRKAKDISPVERPSLKRVSSLAAAACLNISKALTGGWLLTMGKKLKRGFKTLKEIWELLIVDDWHLTDLFCPPPKEPVYVAPLFAPVRNKYSAVPFCDDDLIDTWRLGVNAALTGRSPPGGEAV